MQVNINKLYSEERTGVNNSYSAEGPRTQFQMDFDRLIFSSAFRRLQNKTQVFPLPGSVFVHNRLTHSLEVASVGRSLGNLVGFDIVQKYANDLTEESKQFYQYDLYNVIASACLCHDIGNPAFGHSGEDAIATYFEQNESSMKHLFTEQEWQDFVNFEGNANGIRVLSQHQKGKADGGLMLTYTTLASIAKYPCESIAKDKKFTHRKKFGFFQSEKEIFAQMAQQTQMQQESEQPIIYKRHPFVWLVEAADDICYNIIDLEDAHRLGIIGFRDCEDILIDIVQNFSQDFNRFTTRYNKLDNHNAKIAYLRAKVIGYLTQRSRELYAEHFENILNGEHSISLYDIIQQEHKSLQTIESFSIEHIYNHKNVIEVENAGYNVMYELLDHFLPAILTDKDKRKHSDKLALKLLPKEFNYDNETHYQRTLGILDFISGMTDNFATELYKRIKGINIGMRM